MAIVYFSDLEKGSKLPATEVGPISRREIVRYVAASGDFNQLYYDDDYAQHVAKRGVTVPAMLVMSYFTRMLANWTSSSVLRTFSFNLSKFVRPDDSLILQGIVIEQHPQQSQVKVELWAENQNGEKVATAQAILVLPQAPDKPLTKKNQESGLYIAGQGEKAEKPELFAGKKAEELQQAITEAIADAANVGNKIKSEISKTIETVVEAVGKVAKGDANMVSDKSPAAKAPVAKEAKVAAKAPAAKEAKVAPKAPAAKEAKAAAKAPAAKETKVAAKAPLAKEAKKEEKKAAPAKGAVKAPAAKEAKKEEKKAAPAKVAAKAPAAKEAKKEEKKAAPVKGAVKAPAAKDGKVSPKAPAPKEEAKKAKKNSANKGKK